MREVNASPVLGLVGSIVRLVYAQLKSKEAAVFSAYADDIEVRPDKAKRVKMKFLTLLVCTRCG